MAITKIPARDYTFEVDPAGGTSYVEITGLTTWSHKPSSGKADTTDFGSAGRNEHLKMSTGDMFTLEGQRKADVSDGSRDAGQAACETLWRAVGLSSLGAFRFTDPDGEVKTFRGSCVVTHGGGGNDDVTGWSVEIEVSGDITVS